MNIDIATKDRELEIPLNEENYYPDEFEMDDGEASLLVGFYLYLRAPLLTSPEQVSEATEISREQAMDEMEYLCNLYGKHCEWKTSGTGQIFLKVRSSILEVGEVRHRPYRGNVDAFRVCVKRLASTAPPENFSIQPTCSCGHGRGSAYNAPALSTGLGGAPDRDAPYDNCMDGLRQQPHPLHLQGGEERMAVLEGQRGVHQHCYAEEVNLRRGNRLDYNVPSLSKGAWNFNEREPREWAALKDHKKVFVCDVTDLFHDGIPDEFRDRVFDAMEEASWHTFQIPTKRPENLSRYVYDRYVMCNPDFKAFPSNVWLGTTVESRKHLNRIGMLTILKRLMGPILFISFEPLLEDIGIVNLHGIDWLIVGAESGANRRPFDLLWCKRTFPGTGVIHALDSLA